jgi:hypothetical protein
VHALQPQTAQRIQILGDYAQRSRVIAGEKLGIKVRQGSFRIVVFHV